MEDNGKMIESLLEKAVDYGKTTFELGKLRTVDKAGDVISSFVPQIVVLFLIASFLLFFNLGLAIWLGEILGRIFYGFFVVAGFYIVIAIIIHFFMHSWIKNLIHNFIIKQVLK